MQRRVWLKLGVASAAVLAVAGGTLALWPGPATDSRLSPDARPVMQAVGAAILEGSLPGEGAARTAALAGLLSRLDDLVAGLPPHAQRELAQLLQLLGTAPGRRWLAGVEAPWPEASVAQVQAGLQGMRVSRLSLRRQAYQALHDLVAGAYFADPRTWAQLGYPGPRSL